MYYQIEKNTNIIVSKNESLESLGNIPSEYYLENLDITGLEIGTVFDKSNIESLYIKESNNKIYEKIAELDKKRSRAFFEPSEKEIGLTWLDFYNNKITNLRTQIKSLNDL